MINYYQTKYNSFNVTDRLERAARLDLSDVIDVMGEDYRHTFGIYLSANLRYPLCQVF
jgi:hypothetical protein